MGGHRRNCRAVIKQRWMQQGGENGTGLPFYGGGGFRKSIKGRLLLKVTGVPSVRLPYLYFAEL